MKEGIGAQECFSSALAVSLLALLLLEFFPFFGPLTLSSLFCLVLRWPGTRTTLPAGAVGIKADQSFPNGRTERLVKWCNALYLLVLEGGKDWAILSHPPHCSTISYPLLASKDCEVQRRLMPCGWGKRRLTIITIKEVNRKGG